VFLQITFFGEPPEFFVKGDSIFSWHIIVTFSSFKANYQVKGIPVYGCFPAFFRSPRQHSPTFTELHHLFAYAIDPKTSPVSIHLTFLALYLSSPNILCVRDHSIIFEKS